MSWTVDAPPAVAKSWPKEARRRCVLAANAALSRGKSEKDAILACIAAGKTAMSMSADATLAFRLGPSKAPWSAMEAATTIKLGNQSVAARRFKKDVVRTGEYVKVNDGLFVNITMEHLANWVMQFKKMKANGVKVPIPDQHRNFGSAKSNMGWVQDFWIEGDTLWMSCQIIGEDAIAAVSRADVSLESPPKMVDGEGNVYDRPIEHVALCTDPVVPGLGEFIPLSMSLRLQGRADMLEFLQKLGAMLGLDPATMTDEVAASEVVLGAVAALLEKLNGAGDEVPPEGAVPPAPPATPPVAASGGAVRKESVTREYGFSTKPVSPMMVKTIAENRGMKIDRLVEGGKVTTAVADDLRERFIGADAGAVKLALERDSDGADFDAVVSAFEKNDPIALKEKTGPQTVVRMSDARKGDGAPKESPLVANAKARAKAADERRVAMSRSR